MRVVAFKQTRVFVLFWLCVGLKFQLCSLKILPFFVKKKVRWRLLLTPRRSLNVKQTIAIFHLTTLLKHDYKQIAHSSSQVVSLLIAYI